MKLNIDIGKLRENLQKQKEEINEKLRALSIVEEIAETQNGQDVEDNVDKSRFSEDMNLINSAKSIFANNPNREFLVDEIENMLRKGGVKGNYGHTTISSTLKRLVKRGDLRVRKYGNKNRFKLELKESAPLAE